MPAFMGSPGRKGRRTGEKANAAPDDLRGALGHPLRRRIVYFLLRQEGSPSEIARAVGVRTENITYHVDSLRKLKVIELVASKIVGSRAVKHHYRLTQRPDLSASEYRRLSGADRGRIAQLIAELVSDDVALSRAAGLLGKGRRLPIRRLGGPVDDQALDELQQLQDEHQRRAERVLAAAKSRVEAGVGGTSRMVRVVMMLFPAR